MIQIGQRGLGSTGLALALLIVAGCAGKATTGDPNRGGSAGAAAPGGSGNSSVAGSSSAGSSNAGSSSAGSSSAGSSNASSASGGASGSAGDGAGGPTPNGAGAPAGAGAGGWGPGPGGGGTSGASPSVGTAGTEVLLTPVDGWIDGASNALHIQGAVYAGADERSAQKLSSDFSGSKMCIKGSTAVVDMNCTPVPPAPDCWMTIWGAGIYLNLNQTTTASTPATFDARALRGFSFELSGPQIPRSYFRFQVESADPNDAYCTQNVFKPGANSAALVDLVSEHVLPQCVPTSSGNNGAYAAARLVRLRWAVVTNSVEETPYDFCVSNVRAIYK
jgi:hypothetical protein